MKMIWLALNPMSIFFQWAIYLIIDNCAKFVLARFDHEWRFNILIGESFCIGLIIGALSHVNQIPWLLVFFLNIHLIGTMYSYNGFTRFVQFFLGIMKMLIQFIRYCFSKVFYFRRVNTPKTPQLKPIPDKYRYNFHLKPTNDLRLQQPSFNKSWARPGMSNTHGSICSLNALLQSLASLDEFYLSLKRSVNLSRFTYDSILVHFIDLLSQLRNDYHLSTGQQPRAIVDASPLSNQINAINPNLLSKLISTDICELFQSIIDLLNQSLSREQSSTYSNNVIEQVQNTKFTTFSMEQINKVFNETEQQLHEVITLDNIDSHTSLIIEYVDITWLLHHIQLGSVIKQKLSGQILHAHCCSSCSHVRFRTEPFQILSLSVSTSSQSLERLLSEFTRIDIVNVAPCAHCSHPTVYDSPTSIKITSNGNFLNNISSTLSPIITSRRLPSDHIFASTPIAAPNGFLPSIRSKPINSQIKSQMMIANLPEVLCIQLKRFTYDRISQRATKLTTPIRIDPEKILDLSSINYRTWLGLAPSSNPSSYRLHAVCLHLSEKSTNGLTVTINTRIGHSVCLFRSDATRWFLCDDERVTEINHLEHFFQTPYVTENCYLLFYARC